MIRPYLTQPERDLRRKLVCQAQNNSLEYPALTELKNLWQKDNEFPELNLRTVIKGFDLLTERKNLN